MVLTPPEKKLLFSIASCAVFTELWKAYDEVLVLEVEKILLRRSIVPCIGDKMYAPLQPVALAEELAKVLCHISTVPQVVIYKASSLRLVTILLLITARAPKAGLLALDI